MTGSVYDEAWATCPKCGKSRVEVCGGRSTCMYFPLIIEDGKAKPSGHNITTFDLRCLECGHRWTVNDGKAEEEAQKAVSAEAIAEKQSKPHISASDAESGEYEAVQVNEACVKGLSNVSLVTDNELAKSNKELLKKLCSIDNKLGEILEVLKGKPDRTLHG